MQDDLRDYARDLSVMLTVVLLALTGAAGVVFHIGRFFGAW